MALRQRLALGSGAILAIALRQSSASAYCSDISRSALRSTSETAHLLDSIALLIHANSCVAPPINVNVTGANFRLHVCKNVAAT